MIYRIKTVPEDEINAVKVTLYSPYLIKLMIINRVLKGVYIN